MVYSVYCPQTKQQQTWKAMTYAFISNISRLTYGQQHNWDQPGLSDQFWEFYDKLDYRVRLSQNK